MKRNKYLILLPFVAILMVGCAGKSASVGNGAAVSSAMSADYVVLSPKSVANNISVTGTLMPGESAMLSAQTSGLVKQIYFKEGQRVTLGQLLVKLDDRQWLAQRQKLDAQLAMAEKDLARKQQLLDIKGISQAEVDDAALLISSIEADKKELDVMIDYAAIRAPFSGLVGLRSVSPGAYLAAGSPVARLVQVDPLKLEFSVPEQYAGQVKKGQLLRFSISGNDSVFLGTVYALEPVITETTRALRVRANVPNG
ncbi:MAG: efflux RND transporter periplasmic adaptor subunit [Bacteroidia bacterium]|nr:efflux RND transporter periplasmic adaptor subunit [Bacteroidia bacterium]